MSRALRFNEASPPTMDDHSTASRFATNDFVDKDPTNNGTAGEFTKEQVFNEAFEGNAARLHGLLHYLQHNNMRLTSPEFKDKTNGKTALLKALLNLKNGQNDTIDVFLDIAEKTGDLKNLINAEFTDKFYKGQTPLHVAIERRSFRYVELLLTKGADVQAKATGEFFQHNAKQGFYFGELPLSLAACTNQPRIVTLLMLNPHRRAEVRDQDSQGNTVLHILVITADNTEGNTKKITEMYDRVLFLHNKLKKETQNSQEAGRGKLEEIQNNRGLTPLKLAAKLGRIQLLRHMLQREFKDEETRHLSRRFTEWVYGPVHCSLYDISSVDTNESNSVLEIIVFGRDVPNRPEMLEIEPLRSLLEEKWDMFASKLFLLNFLVYLMYLIIFTTVALHRKDGQPPFPVEGPVDCLRCVGEMVSVVGALKFFYQSITFFQRNRPNLQALFTDGFSDILFVFLFGFSAAVVALMSSRPLNQSNLTDASAVQGQSSDADKPKFSNLRFTVLEMFKFTIGMGDLQFTDQAEYKEVFYVLLICYIVLTYILALNMLIALMGNTVERISSQSEIIWNLQRAFTILDLERSLPTCLRKKLQVRREHDEYQGLFRVEERDWKQWRSDLGVQRKEDPLLYNPPESHWNVEWFLDRMNPRRRLSQQAGIP
ncbi:transient receptor potential cation channel subfamily V member 1-like [Stegastes partitus]|uniref:Transient receptor potential cation channel subfamily V member 1-like n=1 Tax=Stegastes partitus TaxID=144197 RepID=A0A9Y4JX49_9TELE|nr:PREDICTED: transient receptor potential cation channel subfamily V member 1-like [Stegastes partitus]